MTPSTKISIYSWAIGVLFAALFAALFALVCVPDSGAQPVGRGEVVVAGEIQLTHPAIPEQVQFVALTSAKISTLSFVESWLVHVKTSIWVYGDAWVSSGKESYHAHLWRITAPGGYVWVVQGSSAWWATAKANLGKSVEVQALLPLPQVGSSPKCKDIAEAILVNVTSDAGALLQPGPVRLCNPVAPTDAGAPDACHTEVRKWPDGAVVQCGGYWLLRSRWGGPEPTHWKDLDAGVVKPGSPSIKPAVPIKPTAEELKAPDAATTKTCWGVPVGAVCPK